MSDSLRGVRAVVTAGGTREPIDPVRYIGNRSSGKMGNALAAVCVESGATVTLITAAPQPAPLPGLTVTTVETAEEMGEAVWSALSAADVLFMAAAVADYRPRERAAHKLKKSGDSLLLELIPTADILTAIREHPRRAWLVVVGFAAETDDLVTNAADKLVRKGLDLIVLNDVGAPGIGMAGDDNAVTVLDSSGIIAEIERAPKLEVARRLVEVVAPLLRQGRRAVAR